MCISHVDSSVDTMAEIRFEEGLKKEIALSRKVNDNLLQVLPLFHQYVYQRDESWTDNIVRCHKLAYNQELPSIYLLL